MIYTVRYLKREQVDASEEVSTFEDAKALVEGSIEAGTADSAEVIDGDGKLVFRRPRTVRSA